MFFPQRGEATPLSAGGPLPGEGCAAPAASFACSAFGGTGRVKEPRAQDKGYPGAVRLR